MKLVLLTLTLSASLTSFGQLAIINDGNGYIDLRADTFENSKIVGRIFDDDIFRVWGYDNNGKWNYVDYMPDVNSLELYKRDYYHLSEKDTFFHFHGYIQPERTQLIEELDHIPTNKNHRLIKDSTLTIWNDSIKLEVTIVPFNAQKHKVEKEKRFGSVTKIDGKHPTEMTEYFPLREFSKIKLSINNKPVYIPKNSYDDLFDPVLNNINIFFDKKGNIYILMPDDTAGGGYTAAWVIVHGKYLKRDHGGTG